MSNITVTTQMSSVASEVTLQRRQWRITGRVQGVGFRPFVHRIASERKLTGFVLNDSNGVTIEAQGLARQLSAFDADIRKRKPAHAIIQEITSAPLAVISDERSFLIGHSCAGHRAYAEIAPDLAMCSNCQKELRDSSDKRRGHYALINCTDCGPRFSIIRKIPYDRLNTTMAAFAMCPKCRSEYGDPANRRFHAQPTACRACGPAVELVDPLGRRIDGEPIEQAAKRLLHGEIIAIKGVGGFHLAVRADDERAVLRLREKKHRVRKPFALMVTDLPAAQQLVHLSDRAITALTSSAAPIVLAPRRRNAVVAASVAPGTHRLGVMLAYTPMHHLLMDALREECMTLVMTSANDTDEPLVFADNDAIVTIAHSCDAILWHKRPIERAVDDSVILDADDRAPILLRRSRGFVPAQISLPVDCGTGGLCVGGELKNAIAIVRNGEAILSQHLGDLTHAKTYASFKQTAVDLMKLVAVEPRWIAHDLHPAYVSTMFARQLSASLGVPRIAVQHHHAHAAAVLAEHGETGPALAVICDGTGYGTDGTIWGGELLMVGLSGFRRLAYLRHMRLPGGDAAAKQTWRSGLSLLYNTFGEGFAAHPSAAFLMPDNKSRGFVAEMIRTRANCVKSSSAGRLFDGVAAIIGVCHANLFEAQAPMALESAAIAFGKLPQNHRSLFQIRHQASTTIDFSPLVQELVSLHQCGTPTEEMSAIFHDQFVAAWETVVMEASKQTGLNSVVLSGGVFCNQIVDRELTDRLIGRGLHVLRHQLVPPNDGGLALGQAAVAAYRTSRTKR